MTNPLHILLQISLGIRPADDFPTLTDKQWETMKEQAIKHTVLGIGWGGIEKLPLKKQPPRSIKLVWIADLYEIKRRNEWMDKACRSIVRKFEKIGLYSVILKGQGIAQLYPTPSYRMSGDIDILVSICPPKDGEKKLFIQSQNIDKTVRTIQQKILAIGKGNIKKTSYHHIEWEFSNVEIEVHLRPMEFNCPQTNMRFQQWARCFEIEETTLFHTPSIEFNIIFMLSHLYHHMLFEGVGLRQVCDYIVLLQAAAKKWESNGEGEKEKAEISRMLKGMKMDRFAAGFMWIMQSVFGLSEKHLIATPDEHVGRFILKEIEQAGNFGKYDERIKHERLESTTGKFWERTKHRIRFLRLFPSEIIWDIPFRLWHWTWRLRYGTHNKKQ